MGTGTAWRGTCGPARSRTPKSGRTSRRRATTRACGRSREQAGPAWYAALTPDNRFVAATEVAGQIRIYDTATGKLIRSFDGRQYEDRATFSPDGTLLATRGADGAIRLYEFATGRLLREL